MQYAGVVWEVEVEVEVLNRVSLMPNPRWRLNAGTTMTNAQVD